MQLQQFRRSQAMGLNGSNLTFNNALQDPSTGEFAKARNSNLNEDLGKVEYVFSDKTGTLTSNEMQLREIAIKSLPLGSAEFKYVTPSACFACLTTIDMVHHCKMLHEVTSG